MIILFETLLRVLPTKLSFVTLEATENLEQTSQKNTLFALVGDSVNKKPNKMLGITIGLFKTTSFINFTKNIIDPYKQANKSILKLCIDADDTIHGCMCLLHAQRVCAFLNPSSAVD